MTTTYLHSKPRYELLDGLRGVAALLVILFHCFETYKPMLNGTQIIDHGYLAVDFFFILSGFVIGYAYDERLKQGLLSTSDFFKRRFIRLHPMVVAGTLIGACFFFFGDCQMFSKVGECEGWKFALCLLMGLCMIPCNMGLDIRGWGEFNSFNGPNWSLTFEYIGNILYVLVFRRLPTVALALLCAGSLFFTLDLTMGWNVFGLLTGNEPQFNVIGGWSLTPEQLYIGFTRLAFPFLCGIIISRFFTRFMSPQNPSGSPIRVKGGFWWCTFLLTVVFAIPRIGGHPCVADGFYQVVAIVAVFPVIVMMGAGSSTTDVRSARVCRFLGDLSYPLYITHFPLMYMQMAWVERHQNAPLWMHVMLNLGIIAMAIFTAYACFKLYDIPIREWLKKNMFHTKI